jgi:hypothetical protein
MREEYSDRKLFLGMALSSQNSASPSSAANAMTWLQRERGAQGMAGRDHGGARQLGAERQCIAIETHQIADEQEQAANPRW